MRVSRSIAPRSRQGLSCRPAATRIARDGPLKFFLIFLRRETKSSEEQLTRLRRIRMAGKRHQKLIKHSILIN